MSTQQYLTLTRLPSAATIDVAYTRHPSGASTLSGRLPVPQSYAGWLAVGFMAGFAAALFVYQK